MSEIPRMICSPALAEYMRQKKKNNLVVEVASSNTSDFEVTELYLRLVSDAHAQYLKEKKRYRGRPLSPENEPGTVWEVLLPPYHLHIEETVRFDCRKYWIFHRLTMEGIRL